MALNEPDYFIYSACPFFHFFFAEKKIALTPSSDSPEILYQLICNQNPLLQLKKNSQKLHFTAII